MNDQLKEKIRQLKEKKRSIQPDINKLNSQKGKEIQVINIKYDDLISQLDTDSFKLEQEVFKDLIESYSKVIMDEFDAKRSVSEYNVTNNIKDYKNYMAGIDMYPKELIEKLNRIINGEKIENFVFELDDIKKKYAK